MKVEQMISATTSMNICFYKYGTVSTLEDDNISVIVLPKMVLSHSSENVTNTCSYHALLIDAKSRCLCDYVITSGNPKVSCGTVHL